VLLAAVAGSAEVPRSQAEIAAGALDKISWILDDCNIPPDMVAVEISEVNLAGRNADLVQANLKRFARLGIDTVLDDFGADTAALGNVAAVNARMIKCDRTLVRALDSVEDRQPARAVLQGAVGLTERLGIAIVAKGVATLTQTEELAGLGFTEMQGDALAPAMEPGALVDWLAERSGPASRAAAG